MAQAVFLDFDGTVCDTQKDILDAYMRAFTALQIPVKPEEFRIGPPLEECIRQVMPEFTPELLAETASLFRHEYDTGGFPCTAYYEGMEALLKELTVPAFIATNKRMAPLVRILDKLGGNGFFRRLYSADMLMPEKPRMSKKETLLFALEENNLTPSECVMIGDTEGDIIAGRAAGMKTVAVTWGYAEAGELEKSNPDFTVNTMAELQALLQVNF